jgi:hypothetical protein
MDREPGRAGRAAPLVAMYDLRDTVSFGDKPKAPPGQVWRLEDITTPKRAAESGYVSPNVDVAYGFGFADLAAEPVILTAPNSGGRRRPACFISFSATMPRVRTCPDNSRTAPLSRGRPECNRSLNDRTRPHRLRAAFEPTP